MIAHILEWLAGLPPLLVYLVIGVLAALENIFPPVPADTAVALGAFLAHRGVTSPTGVLLVTLASNTASAMGMYLLAARHSQTLFRSRLARRLLPDEGLAFVRREYGRFGLPGLFVGRLLPGFRAVVPPFAGLIHLGAWRTLAPILLASVLWYGLLVFLASQLGAHWDAVLHLIGRLNQALAIVAGIAALLLGLWIWRRWRARRGDA